jgi:methionyl aminopeptidase
MIVLKTPLQISQIKENGLILRNTMNETILFSRAGASTKELDKFIENKIREAGATPTFKGYRGFPAASCISVNDVYVHGIPSNKIKIKDGDVISIDIGVTKNGCIADSCYTYRVGNISPLHQKLMQVAHDATMLGIQTCKPGVRIHDIAKIVFEYVNSFEEFTVVEHLYGHGTGVNLHEAPTVTFCYPVEKRIPNVRLIKDMVITIEPVIGFKSSQGKYLEDKDKWTLRSLDGSFGAQYEHTIAITEEGSEILTGSFLPLDLG